MMCNAPSCPCGGKKNWRHGFDEAKRRNSTSITLDLDHAEDLPRHTRSKTELIRKAAKRFRVGEMLYLFHCDTGPQLYGVLQGAFVITEIKHQSDTGVSFFLRHQWMTRKQTETRTYLCEFSRDQVLHRLSGPPVSYVIEEGP